MNKILIFFCFLIGTALGKRNYLKECVVKFQIAITEVCQTDFGNSEPCFNDDIVEQYGYNMLLTTTKLSFECCDLACTSESISRDFCCHDESCRQRCSLKNNMKIREAPLPVTETPKNSKNSTFKPKSKAAEFRFRRMHHRHH